MREERCWIRNLGSLRILVSGAPAVAWRHDYRCCRLSRLLQRALPFKKKDFSGVERSLSQVLVAVLDILRDAWSIKINTITQQTIIWLFLNSQQLQFQFWNWVQWHAGHHYIHLSPKISPSMHCHPHEHFHQRTTSSYIKQYLQDPCLEAQKT